MPMQLLQKLTHRPIVRDRIRHGRDRIKPEDAVLVAAHDAAPVGPVAAGILHVVVARRVGLPDIDLDALNGLAVCVLDGADDKERLALGIVRHQAALGDLFGFVSVEGAEDGAFG